MSSQLWLPAVDFFDDDVPVDYGIEENGFPGDDIEGVEIPSSQIQLTDEQMSELQGTVNPLSDSDNFAIELYQQTLQFILSVLNPE